MKIQDNSFFSSYSLSGEKLGDISKAAKVAAAIFAICSVGSIAMLFTAAAVGEAILALALSGVFLVFAFDSYVVAANADKANSDRLNRFGHMGASLINGLLSNEKPENAEEKLLTKNTLLLTKLV